MRRGFAHEQETELWKLKSSQSEYSTYLTPISENDLKINVLKNHFGTGVVKMSGYVDTKAFMERSHHFFKSIDSLLINEYESKFRIFPLSQ